MRTTPIRSGSTESTALRHIHGAGVSLTGIAGQSIMDTYGMANGNVDMGGLASGSKNMAQAPVGS